MNNNSVAPPRDARNNQRLRALVAECGLTQAAALDAFNASIGARPLSLNGWHAYFVNPNSTRWRPFSDRLLAHAEKVFVATPQKSRAESN